MSTPALSHASSSQDVRSRWNISQSRGETYTLDVSILSYIRTEGGKAAQADVRMILEYKSTYIARLRIRGCGVMFEGKVTRLVIYRSIIVHILNVSLNSPSQLLLLTSYTCFYLIFNISALVFHIVNNYLISRIKQLARVQYAPYNF